MGLIREIELCPICKEPLQQKEQFGSDGLWQLVNIPCDCAKKRIAEDAEIKEALAAYNQKDTRIKMGYPDDSYLADTFDKDNSPNSEASKTMRRYVSKWPEMKEKNLGLILCGNCGTGKTFYASCIANEIRAKYGDKVYISSLPAMVDEMGKNFGENAELLLNKIQKFPLLVIDDLGVERNTAYSYEKAERIINARCRSGKPLIVTTNHDPAKFKDSTDINEQRIFSRISEMCVRYVMAGEDRRKPTGNQKAELAKQLLGI